MTHEIWKMKPEQILTFCKEKEELPKTQSNPDSPSKSEEYTNLGQAPIYLCWLSNWISDVFKEREFFDKEHDPEKSDTENYKLERKIIKLGSLYHSIFEMYWENLNKDFDLKIASTGNTKIISNWEVLTQVHTKK